MNYADAAKTLVGLLHEGREADDVLLQLLGEQNSLDGSDIGALLITMVGLDHDRFVIEKNQSPVLGQIIELISKYYVAGTLYPNQMRMARGILFRFNALRDQDYLPELLAILNGLHMSHIKHYLPSSHPRAATLLTEIVGQLPNLITARTLSSVFMINLMACCELIAPHLTKNILPPAIALLQQRIKEVGGISEESILGTTAQIAMRYAAPLKPSAPKPKSALRIAVCVSGQLRGYREAFPTWNNFGLAPEQFSYFIHTWANIGRKELFPIHADRCLSGAVLDAYNELYVRLGHEAMKARYPSLFGLFGSSGARAGRDELCALYGTDNAVVEDDAQPPFAAFNNSMKMYYKIGAAHQLAVSSGRDFDFYIRIRPDTALTAQHFDWDKIQAFASGTRKIITGKDPMIYPNGCAAIDDITAIGDKESMDIYASTWEFAQSLFGGKAYLGFPHVFEGHETLFWSCFYRGIGAVGSHGLFTGVFRDPAKPSAKIIHEALVRDRAGHTRDDYDRKILNAALRDAEAA